MSLAHRSAAHRSDVARPQPTPPPSATAAANAPLSCARWPAAAEWNASGSAPAASVHAPVTVRSVQLCVPARPAPFRMGDLSHRHSIPNQLAPLSHTDLLKVLRIGLA